MLLDQAELRQKWQQFKLLNIKISQYFVSVRYNVLQQKIIFVKFIYIKLYTNTLINNLTFLKMKYNDLNLLAHIDMFSIGYYHT